MGYPPLPNTISIPALVAGNILQNDDTSVALVDEGDDGMIVMRTQNKYGLIINKDQRATINGESTLAQFTINSNTTSIPGLRLSYNDSYYFDMAVTANGNISLIPSCDDNTLNPNLRTTFKKNVDIADHNGSTMGLYLGGSLVKVSASELNYLDVAAGSILPNKAIILDSTMNLNNLNILTANRINGVLLTGSQPNISELRSINVTTQLSIGGTALISTGDQLNYNSVTPGIALANRTLVLDSNKNISNINTLSASILSGTLALGPQPNITSLSALNSLTNNGYSNFNNTVTINTSNSNIIFGNGYGSASCSLSMNGGSDLKLTIPNGNFILNDNTNLIISSHDGLGNGLKLGSIIVVATGTQLNYTAITTPGNAQPTKALVVDANRSISNIGSISAVNVFGTIQTSLQPNIDSVINLNITGHNGSTGGLKLGGVLVTSTGAQLNYVNVNPGIALPSKAIILDSNKSIAGISSISSDTITGTLSTAIQPNISSVIVLNISGHNGSSQGLSLGGTLVLASANQLNYVNVVEGQATASKALILNSGKSISGIVSLSATSLSGVLQTSVQPNINSVNVLDIVNHDGSSSGLSLNGILVTVTANQLNKLNVSDGVAFPGKVLIMDTSRNISGIGSLSATSLTGVLQTPFQPNINSLNTLNIVNHDGSQGLQLSGVLVTANAYQLNYLNVNEGQGMASKALILNSNRNINGINNLIATNISGTLQTGSQPNISSVTVLNIVGHDGSSTGLKLNSILVTATADQLNYVNVNPGTASGTSALIVDASKNISGINSLSANVLMGLIGTGVQPNITSVNTLNIANHNGSTSGLSLYGNLITATAAQLNTVNTTIGNAQAGKALICDSNVSIIGLNSLTCSNLFGLIQTSNQPNITSVNTLNISNHDGATIGLKLNNVLVQATAQQLNYNTVVPGTATSMKSMVTDPYNSISNINTLTATVLKAQTLNVTGVISSFNTGAIVAKTYSGTNFNGRLVDMQLLNSLSIINFQPGGFTNSFSTEFIGYILPPNSETYTFYVQCNDRVRLFVNNKLILHSWSYVNGYRTGASIYLNANVWTPIYIQFQCDTLNSAQLVVQWSSASVTRGIITASNLAWDDSPSNNMNNYNIQNQITLYNSSTAAANTVGMIVDTSGAFTIDASGNSITLGSSDNLNIPAHNGTDSGLYLGGVLVTPTAGELNYLKVSPGTASASHALVLDASKSIIGVSSLTSTTIACTNLSTTNFTISNLTLNGALNNYNVGSLLIRQITGPNVSGRVVSVDTITNLALTNYDPRGLNTYFSLDIIGYILPPYTETFTFHVIADDRCRIFVNNQLILNIWDSSTGLEYSSITVDLIANQWTPIYIQVQNVIGSSSLQVKWSSISMVKSFINSAYMAWDNSANNIPRAGICSDSITLFSSSSGLLAPQFSKIAVDSSGSLSLSSNTNTVGIASGNNLNITGHNYTTTGLRLAGILVTASATELNYNTGTTIGSAVALKTVVLDAGKSITGINSLTATSLTGTLLTGAQPNITSFGVLSSTLNTSSDILITTNNNRLRLFTDTGGSYLQSGTTSTTGSSSDFIISNYNQSITDSNRKFIVKSSGFVGIQTTTPIRTLSINGAGASYCMRIINNNFIGGDVNYVDFGVDTSGNYNIVPVGNLVNISSNISFGKLNPCTFSVNTNGSLNISPNNGSVQIGNTSNSLLPLEVGSYSYSIGSTSFGFLNSTGSTGSRTDNSSMACSIRTAGNIIVGGTVCVTSDRRRKHNITELSLLDCKEFISTINPVSFNYKSGDPNLHVGFIAQDIQNSKFSNLIYYSPDETMVEEIDDNGLISPANNQLNVAYSEIIPILTKTIRDLYNKTDKLESELFELKKMFNELLTKNSN